MTVNFNGVIRMMGILFLVLGLCLIPVSYTHLDVYKRQDKMVEAFSTLSK